MFLSSLQKHRAHALPVVLFFAAFAVRLLAFLFTYEISGDGPGRAWDAYGWSVAPEFFRYGGWPPGYTYIAGVFTWLVPNPLVSVRILNVLMGSLTVPLFYLLIRRLFGRWAAVFSGSILAIVPLHVGLSATSLTEPMFLFLLVAGALMFVKGTMEGDVGRKWLAGGTIVLVLAEMTRYEAWTLAPAFALYYFFATRRLLASIAVASALAVFPLVWSASNYLNAGNALKGFTEAVRGTESGAAPVTLPRAVYGLALHAVVQIGFLIPALSLIGVSVQFLRRKRRAFRPERLLYLLLCTIHVVSMIFFMKARGSIWPRYVVLGIVLCLPYAALPLRNLARLRPRSAALVIAGVVVLSLLIAPSLLFASRFDPPQIYLTTRRPWEIEELAKWLRTSRYRDSAILATTMNWQSTYLILYAPEFGSRIMEYSYWITDVELGDFIRRRKPALLITSDRDREYHSHIEAFLAKPVNQHEIVHTVGTIRVYDIRD